MIMGGIMHSGESYCEVKESQELQIDFMNS